MIVAREVAKRYGDRGIVSISVDPGQCPIHTSCLHSIHLDAPGHAAALVREHQDRAAALHQAGDRLPPPAQPILRTPPLPSPPSAKKSPTAHWHAAHRTNCSSARRPSARSRSCGRAPRPRRSTRTARCVALVMGVWLYGAARADGGVG